MPDSGMNELESVNTMRTEGGPAYAKLVQNMELLGVGAKVTGLTAEVMAGTPEAMGRIEGVRALRQVAPELVRESVVADLESSRKQGFTDLDTRAAEEAYKEHGGLIGAYAQAQLVRIEKALLGEENSSEAIAVGGEPPMELADLEARAREHRTHQEAQKLDSIRRQLEEVRREAREKAEQAQRQQEEMKMQVERQAEEARQKEAEYREKVRAGGGEVDVRPEATQVYFDMMVKKRIEMMHRSDPEEGRAALVEADLETLRRLCGGEISIGGATDGLIAIVIKRQTQAQQRNVVLLGVVRDVTNLVLGDESSSVPAAKRMRESWGTRKDLQSLFVLVQKYDPTDDDVNMSTRVGLNGRRLGNGDELIPALRGANIAFIQGEMWGLLSAIDGLTPEDQTLVRSELGQRGRPVSDGDLQVSEEMRDVIRFGSGRMEFGAALGKWLGTRRSATNQNVTAEQSMTGVEKQREILRGVLVDLVVGRVLSKEEMDRLIENVSILHEQNERIPLIRALIQMGIDINTWKSGGYDVFKKTEFTDANQLATLLNDRPSRELARLMLAGGGFVPTLSKLGNQKWDFGAAKAKGMDFAYDLAGSVTSKTVSLEQMLLLTGHCNKPDVNRIFGTNLAHMKDDKFCEVTGRDGEALFELMCRYEAFRRNKTASLEFASRDFDVRLTVLNSFAILLHSGIFAQHGVIDGHALIVHPDLVAVMNPMLFITQDAIPKNKGSLIPEIFGLVKSGKGSKLPSWDKATGSLVYSRDQRLAAEQQFYFELLVPPKARSWLFIPMMVPGEKYGTCLFDTLMGDEDVQARVMRSAEVFKPMTFERATAAEMLLSTLKRDQLLDKVRPDDFRLWSPDSPDKQDEANGVGVGTLFANMITAFMDRRFGHMFAPMGTNAGQVDTKGEVVLLDPRLVGNNIASQVALEREQTYRNNQLRSVVRYATYRWLGLELDSLGPNRHPEAMVFIRGMFEELKAKVVQGQQDAFTYPLVQNDPELKQWLNREGLNPVNGHVVRQKLVNEVLKGDNVAYQYAVARMVTSPDQNKLLSQLIGRTVEIVRWEEGKRKKVVVSGPVFGLHNKNIAQWLFGGVQPYLSLGNYANYCMGWVEAFGKLKIVVKR